MGKRSPGLGFIFLTLVLDTLGFGLLIPVGPHWIQHLQNGTEADAAHVVSWLAATYAAMQFVFAPMLGEVWDREGEARARDMLRVAAAANTEVALSIEEAFVGGERTPYASDVARTTP